MSSTVLQVVERLLGQDKYEQAVSKATAYLKKYPDDIQLLLARSTAYLRVGKAQESLEDADRSVALSSDKMRSNAQLRRAFALLRLGKSGEAAAVLEYAADCDQPSRLKLLQQQLKGIEPTEVEEIPENIERAPKVVASSPIPTVVAVKKDWYQSTDKVNLDVYIRDCQDKDMSVVLKDQQVSITGNGINFELFLSRKISENDSTYTVSPYKFSFVLKKLSPIHWETLDGVPGIKDTIVDTSKPSVSETGAFPPSTTGSKSTFKAAFEKIWDIEDSDDETNNDDPNAFFSQIYQNADPDTQRAMMKSFVESKGTTLSTNWDEVKTGYVEPLPPKDMDIE